MFNRNNNKRTELRSALRSGDPYAVAKVFQISGVAPQKSPSEPQLGGNHKEPLQENGVDFTNVAKLLVEANEYAVHGYAVKSYESQASLHAAFHQAFGSSTGNWLVPALHAVCKTTHTLAVLADQQAGDKSNAKLQNAVTLLQESFSRTFNDRKELRPEDPLNDSDGSKKVGVLYIVNQLFCIYFSLNTLRLCKNLVRPVESRNLHTKGMNMGDMVTYRYYTGRLNLFEDQYAEAETNLEYAFTHCHKDVIRNKTLILRYLVPVKLYRGRLPSANLLAKYQLLEFVPLVDSIRKGDLRTFNDTVNSYQDRFIRQGTFLLVEKCKTVCYRNLFKRLSLVLQKSQIPLAAVSKALDFLGMRLETDEIECILANLIYRGYLKGYIAHNKRYLVLSKRDPFPTSAVVPK